MAWNDEGHRYLDASRGWAPVHIGKDWVGTKLLGGGTYGIATLFEYQGDNSDVSPRKIVVKQEGQDAASLLQESRILQRLMACESEHIVKIYKAYHRTMGTGASNPNKQEHKDPPVITYKEWKFKDERRWKGMQQQIDKEEWNEVSRIYLELGTRGDLQHWMKENCDEEWPSEEYVWRLWECLLRGLMVLRYGTESRDEAGDVAGHIPVAHFDLKPGNVLIGGNPKPGHRRIAVHKLADFGLSLEVPDAEELRNDMRKRHDWIRISQGRNSIHTPEQNFANHPNRVIGHQTDLWNVANIIYMVINQGKWVNINEHFVTGIDPEPSFVFKTMGTHLLQKDREIYSRKLRGSLLRALAFDPEDRWAVEDQLEVVEEALEHWDFGDEDDLFLGGMIDRRDGWTGTLPEFTRDPGMYGGMRIDDLEVFPPFNPPHLENSKEWKDAKPDDHDFQGIRLLFPTRADVNAGTREPPFELGRAEKPPARFSDWRKVGKKVSVAASRGEGANDHCDDYDDDEEEEEVVVEYAETAKKSKRSMTPGTTVTERDVPSSSRLSRSARATAWFRPVPAPEGLRGSGRKRMRSAEEQEQEENEDNDMEDASARAPESTQKPRAREGKRRSDSGEESYKSGRTKAKRGLAPRKRRKTSSGRRGSAAAHTEDEDVDDDGDVQMQERSAPWIEKAQAPSENTDWDFDDENWDEA